MATYVPAKINLQFIFYTALVQQASTLLMKSSPTLATGDFKTSLDGGTLGNLGTLPTTTPASSVMLKVTLATTEMNGANATFVASDAAGAEWCDQVLNFQTAARQIDDLAYPATSGRSMVVDASGLVDANAVKVGPTGSGTAQTAGDIPARLPAALTANGNMKSSLVEILTTALTETTGQITAAFKKFFDIASPTSTMNVITLTSTVTTLTNLPAITANWITAAGINAGALNGKGDWSTVNPTNLTTAQIATGVWQDTTAGDFTTALSVGKSLMNGVALGTGLTINDLTTKTGFALTAAYDAAKTAAQAGDAMTLTGGTITSIATSIWATVLDGTNAASALMRGYAAVLLGKASGLSAGAPIYRNIADSKNVITATTDADGNRTAITYDLS